jgi:hypothetical protein
LDHAIILATRLFPNGSPVSETRLNSHTILEYQLSLLRAYHVPSITLITRSPARGEFCRLEPKGPVSSQLWEALSSTARGSHVLLADGACLFSGSHLAHILDCPIEALITAKPAISHSEPGVRVVTASCGRVRDAGQGIDPPVFPWDLWSGLLSLRPRAARAMEALLAGIDCSALDLGNILGFFVRSYPVYAYAFDGRWVRVEDRDDVEMARGFVRSHG